MYDYLAKPGLGQGHQVTKVIGLLLFFFLPQTHADLHRHFRRATRSSKKRHRFANGRSSFTLI